jgi:hypothetical protein
MNFKGLFIFILSFLFLGLFFPSPSKAFNLEESLMSENSIIVKVQEGLEYLFAFKVENKIQVLDKHADKRLVMAQEQAENGSNERVQNLMQSYEQIKEKQNNLLGQVDSGEVLGTVKERTIEQQRTMEEIKTKIDDNTKQEVVRVQEQVVNQIAKHVIDANGTEGTTEFLNNVAHVWAPGTGPGGGEAGVVYAGGGKLIYAEGTGPGAGGVIIEGGEMKFATGASMDSPGADVKNIEVKTGGTVNEPVPVPNGPNYAPGTTGDSPNNTIDQGDVNTVDSDTDIIDP